MVRWLGILIFLLIVGKVYAGIFMSKDAAGNITYSDSPSAGAAEIASSPNGSSVDEPPTPKAETATDVALTPIKDAADEQPYTHFSLESPIDQSTFQNQRQIPIVVNVNPGLHKNDKLQLYVDNQAVGAPQHANVLTLDQPIRGEHTVYVTLINAEGAEIQRSKAVTIFVHYAAIGQNQP